MPTGVGPADHRAAFVSHMDFAARGSEAREAEYEIDPRVAAEVEAELSEMDSAEDALTTAAADAGVDPTAPRRSQSTFDLGATAVQAAATTKPEPSGGGGGKAKVEAKVEAEAKAGAEAGGSVSAQPAAAKEDFWRFM
jgi:hypothetical protein